MYIEYNLLGVIDFDQHLKTSSQVLINKLCD